MRREATTEQRDAAEPIRARRGGRAASQRSHLRRATMDWLEARTLMATAPTPVVSNWASITFESGTTPNDDSSPLIAIDPLNPLKEVVGYTNRFVSNGTTFIQEQAQFSIDGGKSWNFLGVTNVLGDPTSTTGGVLNGKVEGVAIGRNEQVTIGGLQSTTSGNAGFVITDLFDFSGPQPQATSTANVVYGWNQTVSGQNLQPGIQNFAMVVDNGLATDTDPVTHQVTTDPTAGTAYIAATTNAPIPSGVPANAWNPFSIVVGNSTDGANWNFSTSNNVDSGHFGPQRDTAPSIAVAQGSSTRAGGNVTVVWDDFGSGAKATPIPFDIINAATVSMGSGGGTTVLASSNVALTTVLGAVDAPYPLTSPVSPIGIGPGPAVAIDNTLGSFSAHPGRIYVTYVDHYVDAARKNPTDNTDVFVIASDDGGNTWGALPASGSAPVNFPLFGNNTYQVNSDAGVFDGHTGAVNLNDPTSAGSAAHPDGRPQFEPSIAVDPATGTVAMSWLDARDDATKSRYADYLATSIDGGLTFSPNVYANPPDVVTDAITGNPVTVGPYLDNQSGGNAQHESTLGFGEHQGLAIQDGVIQPAWSSTPTDGLQLSRLSIATSQATYPYGPRVVSSTSGAVQATTVDSVRFDLSQGSSSDSFNGFTLTFDQPVPAGILDAAAVQFYLNGVGTLPSSIPVDSVRAVGAVNGTATQFVVNLGANLPTDAVYTGYVTLALPAPTGAANGPQITQGKVVSARNITTVSTATTSSTFDNTLSADHTQLADGFLVGFDRPVSIASFTTARAKVLFRDAYGDPSQSLLVTAVVPIDAPLYYDGTSEAEQFLVRFAQPAVSLAHPTVSGTYTYGVGPAITDLVRTPAQLKLIPDLSSPYAGSSQDTPIAFPPGGQASSSISIVAAPAQDVVTGLTVNVTIQYPRDANLTISLVSPSGSTIVLASGVGGAGANFTGTTFSDSAAIPIGSGTAPFSGTFRPQQSLALVNGDSVDGAWTLNVTDNALGNLSGTLVRWSLSITGAQDVLQPVGTGNQMDQNANGIAGQATDVFANPASLTGRPFTAPFDTTTLPIVVPGPHLAGTFVPGATKTADNLVLNNTVGYLDVTFDRNMNPSSIVGTFVVTPAGSGGPIVSMIGPAGPIYGTFVVTADPQAGEDPAHPRTFRVAFPSFQQYSGTYTINLAASITSEAGDRVDSTLRAGVALLFGTPAAGATAVDTTYASTQVPAAILPGLPATPSVVTSTIQVTDSYQIYRDLYLTLNITYPNDPDLTATLTAPDGTVVDLFAGAGNIGASGTRQNFVNTILDDNATASVENGSPPFNGRYLPQQPFSQLLTGTFPVNGTWTLTIKNAGIGTGSLGSLTGWSLTFGRPSALQTGLGDPVADRSTAAFRIFTMDPTNTLASNTWTAVGPASNNDGYDRNSHVWSGNSSRIGAVALDPSDPSGNTAYVAGASGGVWKTTDFLTTDPLGPTYVPLTTISPVFSMNIGSIAVFARNGDPSQSIVVAATGEGSTSSPGPQGGGGTGIGVGFLISYNGGQSWTLRDSTTNVDPAGNELPLSSTLRDHAFVGTTSYKVVVDPHPAPNGNIIIYAALSGGTNGGIWRSLDSGKTWSNMKAGDATDVVLDPVSRVDAVSNPTGNLRTLFAAFRGAGVFISPNQGQTWNLMAGGVGDPLIQDAGPPSINKPIAVGAPPDTPNGSKARIVLAKPALTGNPILDVQYETWLYAAVVTPDQNFNGLYVTKDNGQNWTKVLLPTASFNVLNGTPSEVVPSNDTTLPQYNLTRGQGDYDLALAVDPINPEIVYVGGTRDGQPSTMIRVDITRLADPHSLFADPTRNGGGDLEFTTSPITIKDPKNLVFGFDPVTGQPDPDPLFNPFLNLYRNPNNPFGNNATVLVTNTASFTNDGSGAFWTPFETFLNGFTDIHSILATVDPATGKSRLIVGLDQGVFTGLSDANGNLITSIGSQATVTGSRNGNLQINQFYNGAVQPSDVANAVAQSMFYGMAQDNGFPQSDPNILKNGNLGWNGIAGDGTDVATDQTGSGTSYFSKWPCCINDGSAPTDFYKVRPYGPASTETGRTFGLIQKNNAAGGGNIPGTPDTQWPYGPSFNFAVNPIASNQMILGSGEGRLFGTESQGEIWYVLADPATFDSTTIPALAYGAPDPNGPGNPTALDNYILAGTTGGHIFATFTGGGGGTSPNAWIPISAGLLDGASIERIVTDPTRGTHDAYAISTDHVYYNANTAAAGTTWVDVTGDLFKQPFTPLGNANLAANELQYLNGLAVDWRYVIPNNPAVVNGPTHPMLYVAGEGGVYRTTNGGVNWTLFPDRTLGTVASPTLQQGNLPSAHVTDLDLALGDVNPTTGHPVLSGLVKKLDNNGNPVIDPVTGQPVFIQQTGPNVLVATTYGRGSYAIRLAPIIFEDGTNNVGLSTTLPAPGGSDNVGPNVTTNSSPFISGLSEQTAFGNKVALTLYLVNADGTTSYLGGYDPTRGSTTDDGSHTYSFNNAANETNAFGQFNVQVTSGLLANYFGLVKVQVVATDQAGTRGNVVPYQFTLLTTAPNPPVLDPASDTGVKGDGITKLHSLSFDIGGVTAPSAQVFLLQGRLADGSDAVPVAHITGNGTVLDPNTLPDGTYYFFAQVEDLAGNVGSPRSSPATKVQVISILAPPPPTIALLPSDDSSNGRGATNVPQPHFFGVAPVPPAPPAVGYTITLIDVTNPASPVTLTAFADPNTGQYVVQTPRRLGDGTYKYEIVVSDVAANTETSNVLTFTIKTSVPTHPPALDIVPADVVPPANTPTGVGRTTVRRPHLEGVTDPGAIVKLFTADGTLQATATATTSASGGHPAGYFTAQLPFNLGDGTIQLYATETDLANNSSGRGATFTLNVTTAPFDFSNAGRADIGVFHPSTATWYILLPNQTQVVQQFGYPNNDIPVSGDYDGDGRYDLAVFRPSTDQWYISGTSTGPRNLQFGYVGHDTPVPAGYDTVGQSEIAVYRPSTGQWYILHNTAQGGRSTQTVGFGFANLDLPVPGDYAGAGYAELAVYRPTTGDWIFDDQKTGAMTPVLNLGHQAGDIPVPADYDGIGRVEPALYRPGTGQYIVYNPTINKIYTVSVGASPADVPVPADYTGSGHSDFAVFTPSTAVWTYIDPIANKVDRVAYGAPNDIPIEAPFSYRATLASTASPIGVPGGGTIGGGTIPFSAEPGRSAPIGGSGGGTSPNFASAGSGSATFGSAPSGRSAASSLTSSGKSSVRPAVAAPTPTPLTLAKAAPVPASASPADLALELLGSPIRGKFLLS